MFRFLVLVMIVLAGPLAAQTADPPPPPDDDGNGTSTLPQSACPADFVDGPLYADGREYYGVPARRTVESFLSAPHDSFGRQQTGTQELRPSDVRILVSATDADACRRLSLYLTNGRTFNHDRHSIYFTAGGKYFVAPWHPAQALSNYTTWYARVLVFDSNINLIGAYAF